MKQFETPPPLSKITLPLFQPTPYFWAIFSWPLFVQFSKNKIPTPANIREGGNFVCLYKDNVIMHFLFPHSH